jgi:uncharacterized protein
MDKAEPIVDPNGAQLVEAAVERPGDDEPPSQPVIVAEPAPVSPKERIAVLDLLRGFAVLGILAMNIQFFAMPGAAYFNPTAYGDLTGVNLAVWFVSHVFFDIKFISMFSMLFGAGILLMLERNEKRGVERTGRLHMRRMGWLLLFGLVHAYLLWAGDVLYTYAVCGAIFWLFRKRSPVTLLRLAVVMLAVGMALWGFLGFTMPYWPEEARADMQADWAPDQEEIAEEVATMQGSWLEQMPLRAQGAFFMQLPGFLMFGLWRVGAMMFLGMAMLSSGFLTGNWGSDRYRKVAMWTGLLGLALVLFGVRENFAHGWSLEYSMFFGLLWNFAGGTLLAVCYASVLIYVWKQGWLRGLTRRLESVGRMAFTNYILQTVVCTLIFNGHGLGLFGQVERGQQALVVLAVWALILVGSPIYLQRYGQGPLEKLWRRLTYGRGVATAGALPALAGQPVMGRKDD